VDDLADLNPDIFAHHSGPDLGIGDCTLTSFRKQALAANRESTTTANNTNNETKNNNQPIQLSSIKEELAKIEQQPPEPQPDERQLMLDCSDSFHKSGIQKWNLCHHKAYGIACSLYENNPVANYTVGDPIADVYALLARKNSSIMILADGVNWGPRSRLAARCAVRASMNYINRNLFFPTSTNGGSNNKILTTHDLFKIICRSFDAAQEFILQRKGTMTTLCCSVVVKLKDASGSGSSNSGSTSTASWAVCTLSIGDSTAYVFNKSRGVFELTQGARNVNDDRDMRNVGGALGHVYGNKPDVSNLNYSLMYVKENDIVFLVSDGVSDNLDPIVSQTARRQSQQPECEPSIKQNGTFNQQQNGKQVIKLNGNNKKIENGGMKKSPSFSSSSVSNSDKLTGSKTSSSSSATTHDDQAINLSSLPEMSPYERYICSLAHMNEILLRNKTLNDDVSAQETCAILIEHVMRLTANKRDILEKGLVEASSLPSEPERAEYQASLRERVHRMRGKLDHASIVAYEVGTFK
jgi:serine/threonine protein phosphatase PrpC